ncbi:MAG TPA: hypothetical protein VGX69_11985 [Solirubrobacteraceae bacterium]|nr:hypothetical protein [Solirubrobacteraceae bacterium]
MNLRVEGKTATLYEGPVSAEAISALRTASSPEPHPCNVSENGGNEGFVAAGANATTALYDAAVAQGLAFNAEWFPSLHDFEVTKVGPDENGGKAEGFPSWGYAVNYATANVGGCQFQLAPGNEVLWAYNYFNLAHLLALTAPVSANAGTPFTVHVADGRTGEPISGATIGTLSGGATTPLPGSPSTDASGNATVILPAAGMIALKATQLESVRSNALDVCVHAGADGTCGTTKTNAGLEISPVKSPPPLELAKALVARVLGVSNGHVYSRHSAPRVLGGVVTVAPGGTLRQIRIRLQRRVGRRCFDFSGASERFVRAPRCRAASFFSVGSSESFSYLLPARLPAGRYVYDVDAIETTGRLTPLVGGVSHVVFRVR